MSMRHLGALDFRGVRERRSGAFFSEIWFGEKRLGLGTFDTAEDAARAYDAAAWRLRRPRRKMNFPDVSTSQRAQDLAPLPRLFTDEDRRCKLSISIPIPFFSCRSLLSTVRRMSA
ncbi:ethylene-responsive transcription factor 3-like [Aegilops tauschii subsp. strangulata]|uniref:ethylene-responsive transcription factor 3-like n=1 Tax=Aegilops tauschii subsp. strangulata TaxID=200361 RepID=UPI001ABCED0B|nr:ethylene-responsive transcription factor 7-like [Aegilops tauschii subsp. strangulata]